MLNTTVILIIIIIITNDHPHHHHHADIDPAQPGKPGFHGQDRVYKDLGDEMLQHAFEGTCRLYNVNSLRTFICCDEYFVFQVTMSAFSLMVRLELARAIP